MFAALKTWLSNQNFFIGLDTLVFKQKKGPWRNPKERMTDFLINNEGIEEFIDIHSNTRKYWQGVDKIVKSKSYSRKDAFPDWRATAPLVPLLLSAPVTFTFLYHHFDMDDKKITSKIDCFSSKLRRCQNKISHNNVFSYLFPYPIPPGSNFEIFIIEKNRLGH